MIGPFPSEIVERIERAGVIAVLVVDEAADAVPLARALLAGGVDIMELTLRTPAAIGALREIKANVPEMMAGIGTILTVEQVREVTEAGAAFGVAPGLNARIVREAGEAHLPFAPGVATPSDVELAVECGCRLLKFFPAEPIGGLTYLKSMAAPYAYLGLRFVPLGGINAGNLGAYLADPLILGAGGSWIASRALIQARDWQAITANAREATAIVQAVRKGDN